MASGSSACSYVIKKPSFCIVAHSYTNDIYFYIDVRGDKIYSISLMSDVVSSSLMPLVFTILKCSLMVFHAHNCFMAPYNWGRNAGYCWSTRATSHDGWSLWYDLVEAQRMLPTDHDNQIKCKCMMVCKEE